MQSAVLKAQCDNTFQFPAGTVSITTSINTISTAQWAGDYNVTTGYINGATCTFSSSKNTDFITLRKASDNAVIATGLTPLAIIYSTAMANIEMHINTNAACATENINRTTTITMDITEANNFRGGNDDGFNHLPLQRTNITDVNAFRGGSNDGFNTLMLNKTDITDNNAFKGGNDDGFNTTLLPKIDITDPTAFRGASNDGFSNVLLLKTNITDDNAFKGGSNDGFAYILFNKTNITDPIAFTGGIGRGETQLKFTHTSCDGIIVTWLGGVSTAWENPANWDCGLMPSTSSTVIIPSIAPNFPKVNFSYEIKKLILNPNSSITIQPGVLLKLNGL
jgi:hypothetical protein